MITKIIYALLVVLLIAVSFLLVKRVMELHEVGECIQWREYANRYAGFYLSDWQKEQCEAMGIDVWK